MTMTDPIAAMLTKIRNAVTARKDKVEIPLSKMKLSIVKILAEEGFIENFKVTEDVKPGHIDITLKYGSRGESVISSIKRVSTPGLRRYVNSKEIQPVIGGRGISIVSTSKGIMTGQKAKKVNSGGELLCEVW